MVNLDIPYGHRLMITLGYLECSLGLIFYPIILILYLNGEIIGAGPINIICSFFISLFFIIWGFQILNQLTRKEINGLDNVDTFMKLSILISLILVVEAIAVDDGETFALSLINIPLTIFALIYWGAESHKKYFESCNKLKNI